MAGQSSTVTFAVPIAKEQMCASASENAGADSPARSVPTVGANRPGTTDSSGVFRVTLHLETSERTHLAVRAKASISVRLIACNSNFEIAGVQHLEQVSKSRNRHERDCKVCHHPQR